MQTGTLSIQIMENYYADQIEKENLLQNLFKNMKIEPKEIKSKK